MKRLPVSTLALCAAVGATLCACADEPTTAPDPVTAAAHILASATERSAVGAGLADVTARVLPSLSLEQLASETELRTQLEAIAAALERDDARALERGLLRAERMLARLDAKDGGAVASELDAIRIAVAEARRLVSATEMSAHDETTTSGRSEP